MKISRIVLALVLVVVLAGCVGASDTPEPVGPDNATGATGGLFADDPTQNPWKSEQITVQVVEKPDDREYQPLIEEAIDYWNQNMSDVGWEGEFVYSNTADDPDLPIYIVDEVDKWGHEHEDDHEYDEYEGETVGYAPIYNETGAAVEDSKHVQIASGLNDSSTVDVAAHELGHTLGLEHEHEDKYPVMAAELAVAEVDQSSATERANPFNTDTISLYYNDTADSFTEYVINEFDDVWQYFEAGNSEIVPENVSFEQTDDPSAAVIEVRSVQSVEQGVSDVEWWGYDVDNDGELNTYEEATIKIESNVDQSQKAWHVGRTVTYLFSSMEEGDLPQELESRDADTRRGWP